MQVFAYRSGGTLWYRRYVTRSFMRALCRKGDAVRPVKHTPTTPMTYPKMIAPNSIANVEYQISTSLVATMSPKPTVAI